jgi:hypothetical protein
MKNKLLTMMLILSTAFLTNCAKSSDNSAAATATATTLGSCAVGQVYTAQYNCIPQSQYCTQNFGANYGQYNNQCVAGTTTTSTIGTSTCPAGQVGTARGCLPQNTCPTGYGYEYGYYNNQLGGWCYPQTY